MKQNRAAILLNLTTGPIQEPPIGNVEFLRCFAERGAWLRPISAYRAMQQLEQPKLSDLERAAAVTSFYQHVGAFLEDVMANLVAWAAWRHDRAQSIADLLKRLEFRRNSLASDPQSVLARLCEKRARLDPALFFKSLAEQRIEFLLKFFTGYEKYKTPSNRLLRRPEEKLVWRSLEEAIPQLMRELSEPARDLLASSYNKIKHGPQLIIQDLLDVISRRGHRSQDPFIASLGGRQVRILLDGSRTQETPGELEAGKRVAPFLLADPARLRKLYFGTVQHNATIMYFLAIVLLRTVFKLDVVFQVPDVVAEISARHAKHLGA